MYVFTRGLIIPTGEAGKDADPGGSLSIPGGEETASWKGRDDSEVLASSQPSPAPASAPSPVPSPASPLVRKEHQVL